MVLESQNQSIQIEKLSLSEYRDWFDKPRSSLSSKLSVFVGYEFINYYQIRSSKDIVVYKIQLDYKKTSFYIFDQSKKVDGAIWMTSTSFSPYAGLVLPPQDASEIVQIYEKLIEFIENDNTQSTGLTIEIRLPPHQIEPQVISDQWALWSLGFTQHVGYFGRYLKSDETELNRNRKRRLKYLNSTFKNWTIEFENFVSVDTFSLMLENRQSRYNVGLTHSLEDFDFLKTLSGGNFVKCWKLLHENHTCAAAIVFCDTNYNILQYLGQSECGYNFGTQDLVLDQVIQWSDAQRKLLFLGTSTKPENEHRAINFGLDRYKSSWGASPYTCYRYLLSR